MEISEIRDMIMFLDYKNLVINILEQPEIKKYVINKTIRPPTVEYGIRFHIVTSEPELVKDHLNQDVENLCNLLKDQKKFFLFKTNKHISEDEMIECVQKYNMRFARVLCNEDQQVIMLPTDQNKINTYLLFKYNLVEFNDTRVIVLEEPYK